ncbi:MAG: ATP-binding protein [Bacteroidia bacterium]|nr:ATP-binding protein [Bacteroidia bacterium]
MPRNNLRKALFVLLEVIVLFLCAMGIKQSAEKATIHKSDLIDRQTRGDSIIVSDSKGNLQKGDQLLEIDGIRLHHVYDVEFVLDGKPIGADVALTIGRDGKRLVVHERLTAYYSPFDIVAQLLAAAGCLLIGIFVLSSRPGDAAAIRFKGLTMVVACLVSFTAGYYRTEPEGIGYLLRFLFPAKYIWTGAFLLDFCLRYAAPRQQPRRSFLYVLYALPIIATILGTVFSIRAFASTDLLDAVPYYTILTLFKGVLIVLALCAVGYVLLRYHRTNDRVERRRLMWVLGSVGFSVVWYVLFWQIPTSIVIRNTVPTQYHALLDLLEFPESTLLLALTLSCLGIAIGTVRHRLFDIEVLSRRGLVTFIVLSSLLLLYVLTMYIITQSLGQSDQTTFITASTVVMALLLLAVTPMRSLTQHFVDKYLFRVEYDFRLALSRLQEAMDQCLNTDGVAKVLVDDLTNLLKIEQAVLLQRNREEHFTIARAQRITRRQGSSITLKAHRLQALDAAVYDFGGFCEPSAEIPRLDFPGAKRMGFALVSVLKDESDRVTGLLVFGRKLGMAPFSVEDTDIIAKISEQATGQLAKIVLQEKLTIEMHESNRLRELNRMKSQFVSGVSHDLKTPLTAIRMYTEMISMRHENLDKDTGKYLAVIDGECRRLSKLVDNVLDFSRIEQGKREYHMRKTDIVELVEETVDVMRYQFDISGFTCTVLRHYTSCRVLMDRQAMQDACINLLSNAIKYSGEAKHITVEISRDEFFGRIAVEDFGDGITAEDIPHLFEPFYRSHAEHVQRQGGVGLGLSLVRHIMTAHKGAIEVQSVPGRGSTFTLIIPIQETA